MTTLSPNRKGKRLLLLANVADGGRFAAMVLCHVLHVLDSLYVV